MTRETTARGRRRKSQPFPPANITPQQPLVTLDTPLTQDEIAWLKAAAQRGQRAEEAAQKLQEKLPNG